MGIRSKNDEQVYSRIDKKMTSVSRWNLTKCDNCSRYVVVSVHWFYEWRNYLQLRAIFKFKSRELDEQMVRLLLGDVNRFSRTVTCRERGAALDLVRNYSVCFEFRGFLCGAIKRKKASSRQKPTQSRAHSLACKSFAFVFFFSRANSRYLFALSATA